MATNATQYNFQGLEAAPPRSTDDQEAPLSCCSKAGTRPSLSFGAAGTVSVALGFVDEAARSSRSSAMVECAWPRGLSALREGQGSAANPSKLTRCQP